MTTNIQIDKHLKGTPHWQGVFSADNLPDPKSLPYDSSLIANYSDTHEEGTHWIAMIHLASRTQRPQYMDSFGFPPGGDNPILKTDAPFETYMQRASKDFGHGGKYDYNHNNFQCSNADVCGEYAVNTVKLQALPVDPATDKMRPQWRKIGNLQSTCDKTDAAVKKVVGLRR